MPVADLSGTGKEGFYPSAVEAPGETSALTAAKASPGRAGWKAWIADLKSAGDSALSTAQAWQAWFFKVRSDEAAANALHNSTRVDDALEELQKERENAMRKLDAQEEDLVSRTREAELAAAIAAGKIAMEYDHDDPAGSATSFMPFPDDRENEEFEPTDPAGTPVAWAVKIATGPFLGWSVLAAIGLVHPVNILNDPVPFVAFGALLGVALATCASAAVSGTMRAFVLARESVESPKVVAAKFAAFVGTFALTFAFEAFIETKGLLAREEVMKSSHHSSTPVAIYAVGGAVAFLNLAYAASAAYSASTKAKLDLERLAAKSEAAKAREDRTGSTDLVVAMTAANIVVTLRKQVEAAADRRAAMEKAYDAREKAIMRRTRNIDLMPDPSSLATVRGLLEEARGRYGEYRKAFVAFLEHTEGKLRPWWHWLPRRKDF